MFFCYYMEWTPLSEIVRILYIFFKKEIGQLHVGFILKKR